MSAEILSPTNSATQKPHSGRRELWDNFNENKGAVLGLIIFTVVVLIAISASVLAPYTYDQQFRGYEHLPPVWLEHGSWKFILGTDGAGRDTLSRLIYGAQISLIISFSVLVISIILGITFGLGSVFWGSFADVIITRLMDLVTVLPSILMALLVAAIIGPYLAGRSSIFIAIIAITLVYIPRYIRIVRAAALEEIGKDYVTAARVTGVGGLRLMLSTVLPNCLSPLIVQSALGVSDAILESAALGYLGLGAQPPLPEWGTMIADAREFIQSNIWLSLFPGIAILITVLAVNLIGDGLRDALDPKLRRG